MLLSGNLLDSLSAPAAGGSQVLSDGIAHGIQPGAEHFRGGGEVEPHALGVAEIGAVVQVDSGLLTEEGMRALRLKICLIDFRI